MDAAQSNGYRLLASRYIQKQIRTLRRQLRDLPAGEDLELVHQARVASRRLRAAMRLFAGLFPPKKLKRCNKQIRRLTKALGPARDADVQAEFIEGLLSDLKEPRARKGIQRVLLRLRQRRAALEPGLVKALARVRKSGALAELAAAAQEMTSRVPQSAAGAAEREAPDEAQRHILEGLKEVLACQYSLANPADVAGHHAMRIAVKRLRYSLEICGGLYENGLAEAIKAQKNLQTLLGELHDCDVWSEFLTQFEEEERRRTEAYFGHDRPFHFLKPGMVYLADYVQGRRQQLFDQVRAAWRDLTDQGVWDRLVRTVQAVEGQPQDDQAEATTDAPTTQPRQSVPIETNMPDGSTRLPPIVLRSSEPRLGDTA